MSISVSIVSFNTKDLLRKCLNRLQSQKSKEKINIWVLDNNSSDGSVLMVKNEFPDVKLIESYKNLGFARGQNQILRQIKDEYVLILNPDTEFDDNAIEKMYSFMEENPSCAVSSCKLIDFDRKLQSNGGDFPTGSALLSWLFNLEFLNKSSFHREDLEYYLLPHKVDWVAGTFMMVKTEVFKKVGFLDEDFFMYFEDCEFCYRVRKENLEVMLNSAVIVRHQSGSSSKNPRYNQWRGEFLGLIKFYRKWWGFSGAILVRILIYLSTILRIIAFFLTGRPEKSLLYLRVLLNI